MATLNEKQKRFIVRSLACYIRPSRIIKLFKSEYSVALSTQQVASYDPCNASGERLSVELKTYFDECRQEFLDEEAQIPLAHRAYQLSRLQEILDSPRFEDNPQQVRDTIELAAKLLGGFYNKPSGMSDEEFNDLKDKFLAKSPDAASGRVSLEEIVPPVQDDRPKIIVVYRKDDSTTAFTQGAGEDTERSPTI